jgi:hypothetical protein
MRYQSILAGLGFSLGLLQAAPVPAPERLLPSDTLLLMTVPNGPSAATGWSHHPIYRLWQDPAMGPFRDKLAQAVQQHALAPIEASSGVALPEFLSLLRGQLTFALVPNGWPQQAGQSPALLLLADAGNQADRMSDLLDNLRARIAEAGYPVATRHVADRDFFSVQFQTRPGTAAARLGSEAVELLVGRSGTLFLFGTDPATIERVLVRQTADDAPGSLRDHPDFRSDLEAGLGRADGYVWLNLRPILAVLNRWAREQQTAGDGTIALFPPAKLLAATGLDGLRSLGVGLLSAPDGWEGQVTVGFPQADRTGLMKLLVPDTKDAAPPEFVGADVTRFQRLRIDLHQAWNTFENLVFTVLPTARSVVDLMFFSVGKDQDPNFDLRRELFGNLGDDLLVIERPPQPDASDGWASPPALILLGSHAPDRMAVALKAVSALLPPPLNQLVERVVAGRRIHQLRLPAVLDETGPEQTLGFVGGDGYLGISTEPDLLDAFARGAANNGPALRDLPGFKEATARVGGMANGYFGYENDRITAGTLFSSLRGDPGMLDRTLALAPGFPLDGVSEGQRIQDWIDFSLLPPFEKVSKYFDFSVYGVAVRPEGIQYRMFTPMPAGLR